MSCPLASIMTASRSTPRATRNGTPPRWGRTAMSSPISKGGPRPWDEFGVSSHRAFNYGYYARDESYDTVDEEGFGLYGEPREDLEFTSGQNFDWFPQSEPFRDDWLARSAEMAEKFKADLIWFDFGIGPQQKVTAADENPFAPHLKRFLAYYYNRARAWGKTGVVNYKFKVMPENVAVLDLERARLAGMRDLFWQTDTSVGFTS